MESTSFLRSCQEVVKKKNLHNPLEYMDQGREKLQRCLKELSRKHQHNPK